MPGPYGGPVVMAPPLPMIVELETEPYYVHQGYQYYYRNDGWFYSRQRGGPWLVLPRDRYPREVRYKNRPPMRNEGDRDPRGDRR